MKVKVWGARGSVPSPGPETNRYGGNTTCVQVTLSNGQALVLDAGTGIRNVGLLLLAEHRPIHVLLTHLHLDHIQGLMFFAPLFTPRQEVTVWGPPSPEGSLRDRLARYVSAPLSPVEITELPSNVTFREIEDRHFAIDGAEIIAEPVAHRGPTFGYRITEGDQSLCFLPDHEPAIGTPLDVLEPSWISGYNVARGASLLIHDCQYTDEEYKAKVGWGHSSLSDALMFARRVEAQRLMLFHHDPMHSDDFLDRMTGQVATNWAALGGAPGDVSMAVELAEQELGPAAAPAGPEVALAQPT